MLPVLIVPIDDQNEPIHDVFEVVARDISSNSIGLLQVEPLKHERYAIHFEMADEVVDLVLAIIWKSPMGPFYGSAGRFIERLENFPIDRPLTASSYLNVSPDTATAC